MSAAEEPDIEGEQPLSEGYYEGRLGDLPFAPYLLTSMAKEWAIGVFIRELGGIGVDVTVPPVMVAAALLWECDEIAHGELTWRDVVRDSRTAGFLMRCPDD